eukprot:TRINITY_DN31510_c0_g1_i1.p2 TRINITY_DN31510_c0_g1~~TRINITY_DN31510_c0_g1_i1.p2  ORF type:complete len:104 (-),score=14.02 TRINITY_DN31510_c0_g1_i1:402-713(-)
MIGYRYITCSVKIKYECIIVIVCFFFFKQKTAYEMLRSLVGSEMCIRDRNCNCTGLFLLIGSIVSCFGGGDVSFDRYQLLLMVGNLLHPFFFKTNVIITPTSA